MPFYQVEPQQLFNISAQPEQVAHSSVSVPYQYQILAADSIPNNNPLMKSINKTSLKSSEKCPSCLRCFPSAEIYSLHFQKCYQFRPFTCPSCPQRFRRKQFLRAHYNRVHPSPLISKLSSDVPLLKTEVVAIVDEVVESIHLDYSTGQMHDRQERTFICDYCFRAFKMRANLVQHAKVHERDDELNFYTYMTEVA